MIDLTQFEGWGPEMPKSFHADSVMRADQTRVVTLIFGGDEPRLGVFLPWDGARVLRDRLTAILDGAAKAGEEDHV